MITIDILSLILFLVLFIAQIKKWSFFNLKFLRWTYITSVVLISSILFYQTHLEFTKVLESGPPANYLIPPFTSIKPFLLRSWAAIYSDYAFSFLISLLFLILVYGLVSKARRNVWFYNSEPTLIALSIFLVGHPSWIFYFLITILLYLSYLIFISLTRKGQERRSFYYFWLPAAILTLLLNSWLKGLALFIPIILFR